MKEAFLHYIWKHKLLTTSDLKTTDAEPITIIKVGQHNTNAGPDFLQAEIKIGDVTLVGHVEIHLQASDFIKHNHQSDKNYNNLILHVVYQNDKHINIGCPTLSLEKNIPLYLIRNYEQLQKSKDSIPCSNVVHLISEFKWKEALQRYSIERLERKTLIVEELLQQNHNNWEETFWQLLAHNFGLKVNADFFKQVAQTISVTTLAKHKNQIHQLEALLLGQANLLNEDFTNDYSILLQKEYRFLQKKYTLKAIKGYCLFLRMRPANFPTIRLAQLAMLISNSSHLFSLIKEQKNLKEVQQLFNVTCNDYWHYHYTLADETTAFEPKKIGKQMVDNITINTIVPIVFAYGNYLDDDDYKQKAMNWLQALKPEKNNIIQQWELNKIENKSAFDSQALIHLTNHYCKKKYCLQCAVGNKALGKDDPISV
jgi:hypothetical protein